MLVLALAGIFAYSVNTLGVADPLVAAVKNSGLGSTGTLILLFVVMIAGRHVARRRLDLPRCSCRCSIR